MCRKQGGMNNFSKAPPNEATLDGRVPGRGDSDESRAASHALIRGHHCVCPERRICHPLTATRPPLTCFFSHLISSLQSGNSDREGGWVVRYDHIRTATTLHLSPATVAHLYPPLSLSPSHLNLRSTSAWTQGRDTQKCQRSFGCDRSGPHRHR